MMSGERNVWAASTHVKAGRRPGRTKAFDSPMDTLKKCLGHSHIFNTDVPALDSKCAWQLECLLQAMLEY